MPWIGKYIGLTTREVSPAAETPLSTPPDDGRAFAYLYADEPFTYLGEPFIFSGQPYQDWGTA